MLVYHAVRALSIPPSYHVNKCEWFSLRVRASSTDLPVPLLNAANLSCCVPPIRRPVRFVREEERPPRINDHWSRRLTPIVSTRTGASEHFAVIDCRHGAFSNVPPH